MRRMNGAGAMACVFAMAVSGALAAAAPVPDIAKEWNAIKPPPMPPIRAVTVDPKKTAYFALDMNEINCIPTDRARCAAAVPAIKKLLDEARAHKMPIVITYTHRMKPTDIKKEFKPLPGEMFYQGDEDKLYNNDVAKTLKAKGIDTILLTGTTANGAILLTATGAALRGFKLIVPIDCIPAQTAYQEQFSIWQMVSAPLFRNAALTTLTRSDMVKFQENKP